MKDDIDEMLNTKTDVTQFVGMMPSQTTKPAFRLIALPARNVERTVAIADKDGFKFEQRKFDVEGGYLLQAYKGHSVHIPSLAALRARGLDMYVPMINGENDEIVGSAPIGMVTTKQNNKAT